MPELQMPLEVESFRLFFWCVRGKLCLCVPSSVHFISQLLGLIAKIINGQEVWICTFILFVWGYHFLIILLCFNGFGFYYSGKLVKYLNKLLISVTSKLLCQFLKSWNLLIYINFSWVPHSIAADSPRNPKERKQLQVIS